MVRWDPDERDREREDRIFMSGGPEHQPVRPAYPTEPRPPDPDDYDDLSHTIHRRLQEIGETHPAYREGRKLMFHILEAHERGVDWLDEIGYPASERTYDWREWDDLKWEKL